MSSELIERNKEIFFKRKSGQSYVSLAEEYNLSATRIRQIFSKELYYQHHTRPNIKEIEQACEELDVDPRMNARVQNALRNARLDVNKRWIFLSRYKLSKVRGLGPIGVEVVATAQKIYANIPLQNRR